MISNNDESSKKYLSLYITGDIFLEKIILLLTYMEKWHDYLYQLYKGDVNMNIQIGKYAWMVKIGEKGQFVIPKEA